MELMVLKIFVSSEKVAIVNCSRCWGGGFRTIGTTMGQVSNLAALRMLRLTVLMLLHEPLFADDDY